jgi:hypothetical protein
MRAPLRRVILASCGLGSGAPQMGVGRPSDSGVPSEPSRSHLGFTPYLAPAVQSGALLWRG